MLYYPIEVRLIEVTPASRNNIIQDDLISLENCPAVAFIYIRDRNVEIVRGIKTCELPIYSDKKKRDV